MEHLQTTTSPDILSFQNLNLSELKNRCGLTIDVVSGAHSGAQLCFPANHKAAIKIGSGIENDLILLASQIADNHLTVSIGSFVDNTVTLTAKNGPITLHNGQVLDTSQWARVNLPATIKLGDTSLYLNRDFGIDRVKKMAEPVLLLGGSMIIGALVTALVASGFSRIKEAVANTNNEPAAMIAQEQAQSQVHMASQQTITSKVVSEKIAQAGLNSFISVKKGVSGTIVVSGTISQEQRPQWRSVLQWYDAKSNLSPMVNKVTTGTVKNLKLIIKSVWLDGNDRVVIFEDGQKAKVGDTIKNGWKVSAISDRFVSVHRGQRTIRITY